MNLGLSNALIDILQCPNKAKQMGDAGRTIVQVHSTHDSLEKHENLYKEIIFDIENSRKTSSKIFAHEEINTK